MENLGKNYSNYATGLVSTIENRFDAANKKMSFDKVTTADSYISSKPLSGGAPGFTDYTLHCISKFLWHCVTYDNHFILMEMFVNSDASMNWDTSEICNSDNQPTQRDIEKTLGHELLHVIGVDHNSVSLDLRYYTYQCGSNLNYNLSANDISKIGALYP